MRNWAYVLTTQKQSTGAYMKLRNFLCNETNMVTFVVIFGQLRFKQLPNEHHQISSLENMGREIRLTYEYIFLRTLNTSQKPFIKKMK